MKTKLLKKITTYIALFSVLTASTSVYAVTIDEIKVTDIKESIVNIKGNAEDKGEEQNIIVILKEQSGEIFGKHSGNDMYIKNVTTEKDGSFEFSFKFSGASGTYVLLATDETGNSNPDCYDGEFNFVAFEEVEKFVEKLSKKEISEKDMFDSENLPKYAEALGMDKNGFNSEYKKKLISGLLYNGGGVIAEKNFDGVYMIYKQFEFLRDVSESKIVNDIAKWLTSENEEILNIDLGEYNKLSEGKKNTVLKSFLEKQYYSVEDFYEDFSDKVDEAGSTTSNKGGGGGSGDGSVMSSTPASGGSIANTVTVTKNEIKFSDLSGYEWAEEAILYLSEKEIVNGVSEREFAPGNNLTREQAAKLVILAFDMYEESVECAFTDVDKNGWSYSYIATAFCKGIITGHSANIFAPKDNLTRQDAAVIIYRAANEAGMEFDTEKNDFSDWNEISGYAKDAVAFMAGKGVISGYPDGTFAPEKPVTRAQMAKMIYSLIGGR